ncbi:MAG: hypothetical protein HY064_03625 [Bacteroidetes bacterium]|nr:hypothetical protein [Bacteroidota bacterium]
MRKVEIPPELLKDPPRDINVAGTKFHFPSAFTYIIVILFFTFYVIFRTSFSAQRYTKNDTEVLIGITVVILLIYISSRSIQLKKYYRDGHLFIGRITAIKDASIAKQIFMPRTSHHDCRVFIIFSTNEGIHFRGEIDLHNRNEHLKSGDEVAVLYCKDASNRFAVYAQELPFTLGKIVAENPAHQTENG